MSSDVEFGAGAPVTPPDPLGGLRPRQDDREAEDSPEAVQKALEAAICLRPLVELFADDESFSKWEVDQGFFDEITDVFAQIDSDDEDLSDWTADFSLASTPREEFFLPTEEELKAVAATGSPPVDESTGAGKKPRRKVTFADWDEHMEDAVIKALDSSTPDTSKLQALQKSLEAMLQFGRREAERSSQRRTIQANKFINDACVLSVLGSGWQVMFESALRELLTKHGLLDAWWSGPDVGNSVTPFQRTQALELQALFARFAEELSAFDKRILALHFRCNPVLASAARKQNDELQKQFHDEKTLGEETRGLAASGEASRLGLFAAVVSGAEVMIATQAPKPVDRACELTSKLLPRSLEEGLFSGLQDRLRLRVEAVHQKAVRAFVEAGLALVNPRESPDFGPAVEEAPEEWLRVRAARAAAAGGSLLAGKKRSASAAAGDAASPKGEDASAAPATPGAGRKDGPEEEEEGEAAGKDGAAAARVTRQSARTTCASGAAAADGRSKRRALAARGDDNGSDEEGSEYVESEDDDDGGGGRARKGGSKAKQQQQPGGAGKKGARGVPNAHSRAVLKKWMEARRRRLPFQRAHFLPSATHPHGPFPTKEEKEQLARETGLTVTQVGDWFINARARCWRPMIENINVTITERLLAAETAEVVISGKTGVVSVVEKPAAGSLLPGNTAAAAAALLPPSSPSGNASDAAKTPQAAQQDHRSSLNRSRKGSLLGSIVLMRRPSAGGVSSRGGSSSSSAKKAPLAAAPASARDLVEADEDDEIRDVVTALGLSFHGEEEQPAALLFGALAG